MKRSLLSIITLLCLIPALWCAPKRMMVDKIEPPYWWTSMANDTLQLMVYGQGIRDAEVTLDYPGVSIQSVERPEGLNYLFLYLTVSDQAKPGDLKLRFSVGKKKQIVTYHLLARDKSGDKYEGFDASDVLYLIMPDRFADGDTTNNNLPGRLKNPVTVDRANPNARHGGDIRGMINHLDYIDSLGVTAVWVNPVFTNDMPGGSYHGYATTDYYSIDPRFGSNKEWNEFVRNCQQRGIKVVMDMIFNHVGSAHPWFTDRPTSDWFNFPEGYQQTNYRLSTLHDPYVSDYDLAHTVDGWFVKEMPDLNQRNPHLLKYLIQNSIWWIESSKINGIRMDTYPYADLKAMARWIDEVEKEYPNFNIVGECWYNNEGSEAFWQRGSKVNPVDPRLETVMDFKIAIDGRKYFMEQTDPWNGLNHLYDHLALDYLFPNPQKILTFLDNHDTDRFLPAIPDSLDQWKQAQTFLLTSRGIPQIYYGTELLMNGAREGSDGYVRRDVPGGFPGDIVDQFTQAGRTPMQNDAYDFMSKLLHWRRGEANEVIARGSLKHFMPQNGVYVYRRKLGDKEIHVLMNGNDAPLHITMERTLETLPYGSQWTDVMSGQKVTIEPEMDFAPRQIMILQNF
ncbi:MAG: glycoside hydrolase family 13 protein [Muribaculaceae bacterium]|nr:glycoside hydrolase family 13 protein [Muribaculaceae bacterium]